MQDIAARFAQGDFSLPGFVHAQAVAGTDVMAARRELIRYTADTLPRGGQVRIVSSDSAAIAWSLGFTAPAPGSAPLTSNCRGCIASPRPPRFPSPHN